MLMMEWIGIYLLLGSLVGVLAGLFGIGGGGILVPAFVSIFLAQGVDSHEVMHFALATSMACILVTSFSSMRAHNARGSVNWPLVKLMSPWVIVGTFLATLVATGLSSLALAGFFALFMMSVAINMLRQSDRALTARAFAAAPSHRARLGPVKNPLSSKGVGLAGFGIGAISALVSIGGGSLTVPYLSKRGIEMKQAIGTSAAIGLPIALVASLGYWLNGLVWSALNAADLTKAYPSALAHGVEGQLAMSLGFISLPAAFCVAIASFFTAPYGVKLAHRLPVHWLKKLFACLLMLLSMKMCYSLIYGQ